MRELRCPLCSVYLGSYCDAHSIALVLRCDRCDRYILYLVQEARLVPVETQSCPKQNGKRLPPQFDKAA